MIVASHVVVKPLAGANERVAKGRVKTVEVDRTHSRERVIDVGSSVINLLLGQAGSRVSTFLAATSNVRVHDKVAEARGRRAVHDRVLRRARLVAPYNRFPMRTSPIMPALPLAKTTNWTDLSK